MIDLSGMFWCPRESGRRRENVYGVSGKVCFSQLGRQCQWALLRFTFAPGLIGLVFLLFKTYILLGTVQLHIIYHFIRVWAGDNGWMALDEFG